MPTFRLRGSAHEILEPGLAQPGSGGNMVLECQMGHVEIAVNESTHDRRLSFKLPAAEVQVLKHVDVLDLVVIAVHRIDGEATPAIVNVGPFWVVARLKMPNPCSGCVQIWKAGRF